MIEPHFERQARVSVAVVEGSEGPVALLPTQEEVVSPEADFLDANMEAQRKLAKAEVGPCASYMCGYAPCVLCMLRQRGTLFHQPACRDSVNLLLLQQWPPSLMLLCRRMHKSSVF